MTAPGPRKGGHPGRMDDRWTPISATLWNMSSAVELVVTDLDGTLSDAGERVHPRTIRAVLALGDAGIPVLVATGRRPRTAALVLEAAGLRGPAVMLDGSIGRDLRDGRAFHRVAFSPEAAATVLDTFARDDLARAVLADPVLSFTVVGGDPVQLGRVASAIAASGVGSASVTPDLLYGGSTLQVRPLGVSKWSGVLARRAEPRRPHHRPAVQRRLGRHPRPGLTREPVVLNLIFDADDTLWENNVLFERAIEAFIDHLAHPTMSRHEVRAVLDEIERANCGVHGYGVRTFHRSLSDCLARLRTTTPLNGEDADLLDRLCRPMREGAVEVLPGV